jgi:hypothetical protein
MNPHEEQQVHSETSPPFAQSAEIHYGTQAIEPHPPLDRPPSPYGAFFWPLWLVITALGLVVLSSTLERGSEYRKLTQERKDLASQIAEQQKGLVHSRNMQAVLQALGGEILDLAEKDPEIKRVAEKYQLRRNR